MLTQANISCPVCFGRDACSELMSDVVKGRLKVERAPFSVDPASTEQMAHRVYRNGKVRFWLRPSPPDPVLLQNFEDALCRKGKSLVTTLILVQAKIASAHHQWNQRCWNWI